MPVNTELPLLDPSYTNDTLQFSPERRTILRKVDAENSFLKDATLQRWLQALGVVDYALVNVKGVEYFEVHPFFFPNSAANWSYRMYRDWIDLYQQIYGALAEKGLTLSDGHCFNTVFYFGTPRFIDLGSIQPQGRQDGYREFKQYCKTLTSYRVSAAPHTRRRLEAELYPPKLSDVWVDVVRAEEGMSDWKKLKRCLGQDSFSNWSTYYGTSLESYADPPKEAVVSSLLKSLRPATLYDIGCNAGHYSLLAESFGANVVSCDPDPDCIDALYQRIRLHGHRILPLVADVEGFLRAIDRVYAWLRPRTVDTVLMLALFHHLVYKAGYTLERLGETLRQLKPKSLIIEFVSKRDATVQQWDRRYPKPWYTLDQLKAALERQFRACQVFQDHDVERPILCCTGGFFSS